jgi:hypothetical protein
MSYKSRLHFLALTLFLFSVRVVAQSPDSDDALFASDEVLRITLSGDMKELMNDRDTQARYHPFQLSYAHDDSSNKIAVKIKTRGHFRLAKGNCAYPPLRLNFARSEVADDPVFFDQDKMKLVTPCRGDQYVVNEYLVYKLHNIITPKSFRARLVSVVYDDTVKGKATEPLYGILLEEESQMAKRNNTISIEKTGMRPEQTDRNDFLTMAVFEFLIGNTDWSIQYQQNVKLIAKDSSTLPSTVAYDFDHAGIVRAPYAKPAEELQLASTLTRRYRGFCVTDIKQFDETFALFNSLKDKIYAVYTDNALLDPKYVKATTKFLDDFYAIINDPKEASRYFLYPCDKNGTGNVVIRGLNRD